MWRALQYDRFAWLTVGLIGGLLLSGLWPQTPLHAVATDRSDTFAIATGFVDADIEAVYFLDFLTGDLWAAVMGVNGGFTGLYGYNVREDLRVDAGKTPKFQLVTGMINVRRTANSRARASAAAIYVAEANTGVVAAYAIPWQRESYNSGQQIKAQLVRLGVHSFRQTTAIR
jgi:hypothetical protein